MRAVHLGLLALIGVVVTIGLMEKTPTLEVPFPSGKVTLPDGASVQVVPSKEPHGYPSLIYADGTTVALDAASFKRLHLEGVIPDGKLHLAYWEKWASFEADACQAMVDQFNDTIGEEKHIFVHYLRTSQVDRKSLMASIGHDPPDLVGLWSTNVAAFAAGGNLIPLDDRMKKAGLTDDFYIHKYLELCRLDGTTWGLPTSPASLALFYNKDHFRAKAKELRAACPEDQPADPTDVRPPRTIDELDIYSGILNEFDDKGNPTKMGFLATEPGWFHVAWFGFFGGKLLDPATNTITCDMEENVKTFMWLKRYAEKYGREKLIQFQSGFSPAFDSPFNAFLMGKVSMELQGVWFPMFIRRHKPQLQFGVAPFPCADGVAGPRSYLETDVIGIPRGCKHVEEAWTFIEWVQKTGAATLCRRQGKNLMWSKVPDWYYQGHPNPEVKLFADLAASPYSFIYPQSLVNAEYRDEMNRVFQHIWNWPVERECAADLKGPDGKELTGKAREDKVSELCEREIRRTLGALRETYQKKLDTAVERQKLQAAAAGGDPPPASVAATERETAREGGR